MRRGSVVEPDGAFAVRLVYLYSLTLCHQDLRLDSARQHRPFEPWFNGRRGGGSYRAGDEDGAAQ